LAKTTVDLLIDPEVAKSSMLRHDSALSNNILNTSINSSVMANNNNNNNATSSLAHDDNGQIMFNLNDNFENETSSNNNNNNNIQSSTTPPSSSSSLSNLEPQNNDATNLNIPSVGKASSIDNNDLNDNTSGSNTMQVNNELTNQADLNDFGAWSPSSNNNLFDMNNYKPHREPRGIWLIAPLITKLQEPCQTRILEHACMFKF
jgi:hypothetical protein